MLMLLRLLRLLRLLQVRKKATGRLMALKAMRKHVVVQEVDHRP
jgi:hypothetical protein